MCLMGFFELGVQLKYIPTLDPIEDQIWFPVLTYQSARSLQETSLLSLHTTFMMF